MLPFIRPVGDKSQLDGPGQRQIKDRQMDSDVASVDFEQEQLLLDGSSQKTESVVEVQATSPHHADATCAPEGDILPLSTVQGLLSPFR